MKNKCFWAIEKIFILIKNGIQELLKCISVILFFLF